MGVGDGAKTNRGMMRGSARQCALLCVAVLTSCGAPPPSAAPPAAGQARPRAVVLSLDALAEERLRGTLDPRSIPTLLRIFDEGACADGARPAFPSVTAAGHAALWSGVYGDVNGISANWQPRLPRDRHTLLELVSGYSAEGFRAEPIWVTAARSGLRVAAHHVTQAPHPPAYRPLRSGEGDPGASRRLAAERELRREGVLVFNGYNRLLAPDAVISSASIAPVPAEGWRGIERLHSSVQPLEIAWPVGPDTLHGLLYGEGGYSRLLVARERSAVGGVVVMPAPVDTSAPLTRPLARHFSEPLQLEVDGAPVALRFRLFRLSSDGSGFTLYQSALPVVDGSDPEAAERYVRDIGGWIGNAGLGLLRTGAFGRPLSRGGDGTAEAHYLETAELLARQYGAGLEWLVREIDPELLIDYFPLGDEIDHELLGMIDAAAPGHDPVQARAAQRVRERAWSLVDLRARHALELTAAWPGAALFLSGDHGMRTAWRVFRPNAALRDAGLLEIDDAGEIDLSRTRALSPNGYWISINTVEWLDGIVSARARESVLDSVEAVLLGLRDAEGRAIVTRTYRAEDHPELGLGGAVGGDLYFALAPGYHWGVDAAGPVYSGTRAEGKHGFPSTDRDMHTVLCMWSAGASGRRIPTARTIDLAPTVSAWLGIPPPADARGRSLLAELIAADR